MQTISWNEKGKQQCRLTSKSMITTPQELHRWASATGFVLAQATYQAEEQRENQIKQCSDREQNLQIEAIGTPSRLSRTTKTTKGTTRVPEISHLQARNHSDSINLFSVVALLDLVFSLFFRLMSPLSEDETGRGCSSVQFLLCFDHRLACWLTLFFPFSFDSLCFPARRCNISGTLVVPLVVFVIS